jgi:hypothetical protein
MTKCGLQGASEVATGYIPRSMKWPFAQNTPKYRIGMDLLLCAGSENTDNSRTFGTKCSKGLRCDSRKPFAFNHDLVAGVGFEPTTFGL